MQVNLKLFSPEPERRRTVLLFVLRDKTKTPLPRLVETMEADLVKMWDSISKPAQYVDSKLTDFFDVQYAGLPHFEEKFEDFIADTVVLRRRFTLEGECCGCGSHFRVSAYSTALAQLLGSCSPLDLWELPSLRPPLEQ